MRVAAFFVAARAVTSLWIGIENRYFIDFEKQAVCIISVQN